MVGSEGTGPGSKQVLALALPPGGSHPHLNVHICPSGDALFRNTSSLYSGNAQGAELPQVAVAVKREGWVFFKQASCPSSGASAPQQMGPQCLQKLLFPLWEQRLLPLGPKPQVSPTPELKTPSAYL